MGKTHRNTTKIPLTLTTLILLFFLSLIARFIALGQEAFFIDEVVTARVVNQPVWEFVKNTETSPPLFLYIMKYWMALFGTGHIAIRSFSALAGSLAAPLLYLAALQFSFRRFAATACGAWMALAPMAVWHSQQARFYGMQSTLVALYLLALALYLNKEGKWSWLFLTTSIFIGFSQHYFFVFVPLSILPWFLYEGYRSGFTKKAGKAMLAHIIASCACLIYLPLMIFQVGKSHTTYIPTPTWSDLVATYTHSFLSGPFHQTPDTVFACFLTIVIISSLLAYISRSSTNTHHNLSTLILFLSFSTLPVLIPFFLSLGEKSIFLRDRYTIVALPGFILTIGCLINNINVQWLHRTCTTALLILVTSTSLFNNIDYYTTYQDFDWRGGIKTVEKNRNENDVLLFFPGWMQETYRNNGGESPPPSPNPPENIWLFVWEQNPNEAETEQYKLLKQNHSSTLWVDFPHIKLWQFTMNQQKEKGEG